MTVDDSIIDENLSTLDGKISTLSLELDTLQNIRSGFTKIRKTTRRIQNNKGLTNEIKVIPNPDNLSDADNEKVRKIVYDDCVKKFNALKLTKEVG